MKVKFFAYLRDPEFASCKETSLPAPPTLRDLGLRLGELYGERFRNEFFTPDGSGFSERIIVLVNGRRAEFLEGLNTPLKESDVVLVFPLVAGG